MQRLRKHLTYSNLVASLAAFVALGGTAYAVTKIGSDEIIDDSVRSKDIRDGTIRNRDLSPTLALPAGVPGPQGPQGEKGEKGDPCLPSDPACVGPEGPPGDPGPPGAANVHFRTHPIDTHVDPGGTTGPLVQECEPGEIAIQGGVTLVNPDDRLALESSHAVLEYGLPTGWETEIREVSGTPINFQVNAQAICLKL
jgi:hypothetical protein